MVVDAHEDPASPIPGLRAVHYDFRLAKAAPGESGRVGAAIDRHVAACAKRNMEVFEAHAAQRERDWGEYDVEHYRHVRKGGS